MVRTSLSQDLPVQRQRIGLDTNVFIYFLEDHPRYGARCASLFELIERGQNAAVTSTVTLLELLVQPYRDQKDELAQKIFALTSIYVACGESRRLSASSWRTLSSLTVFLCDVEISSVVPVCANQSECLPADQCASSERVLPQNRE